MIAPLQLNLYQISEADKAQMALVQLFLCPDNQTAQMKLNYLHQQAEEERRMGQIELRNTPTALAFHKQYNMTLEEAIARINEKDVQKMIIRPTDQAFEAVLNYVCDTAFIGEKIYEEQITSNSHNLCSTVKAVNGYSGTMENKGTFPPKMNDGTGWDTKLDKGTNGRIEDYLLKKNPTVHLVDFESPKELIAELLDNHPNGRKFHAWIDTGALFKNYTNDIIAADFVDYFASQADSPIKGVLYYDNTTNLLMCSRKGKPPVELPATDTATIEAITRLKKSELFALFDHRHTRGANIILPDDAAAFITVGKDLEYDQFLQGGMRMRGLGDNQIVEPVILKHLVPVLFHTIEKKEKAPDIGDILLFTKINKFPVKKMDNLEAYMQMLGDKANKFILGILREAGGMDAEMAIYEKTRELFIRSLKEKLYESYVKAGNKQPIEQVLTQYIDKLMKLASQATENQEKLDALNKKLNALKNDGIKNKLFPDGEIDPYQGINKTKTVEQVAQQQVQQQQQQQQIQQQQQVQQQLQGYRWAHEENSWNLDRLRGVEIKDIREILPSFVEPFKQVKTDQAWMKYNACFDSNLLASDNFLKTTNEVSLYHDISKKPVYEYLILRNSEKDEWKAVLISSKESRSLSEFIKKNKENIKIEMAVIANPGLVLASSGASQVNIMSDKQLQGFVLSGHVLNGNAECLSREEWRVPFEVWTSTEKETKRALFEMSLLDASQKNCYVGSSLEKSLSI